MSKTLQFRRGTTSQLSTISGAIGELFVDTTKDTVVVMDGSTAGGFPLASEALLTSVQSSLQSSINSTNSDAFFYASQRQAQLVSGVNIKTINGQSVLGSGNLVITGDGGVLDTSTFATKTDLLILDSDDIDEGLTNQYYTNQKVANVLLNGNHTNISFAYDGSALSATVSLPPTPPASGDTFDTLNIQQEEVVIGTVTSKSIVPPTTQFVEYVSNGNNSSTNPIYAILNIDYGYFYSSYADIYSPNNTKTREFFAAGNTVRITKDGYWWDLQITGAFSGNSTTYFAPTYNVIGTNSSWSVPSDYNSYYQWNQDISFSTNLPVPQKYALTLNNPAIALGASDKLLFNGDPTDAPYNLNLTDRGSWSVGITSGATDQVIFGSNSYYANQDPIKELLQVGTTVTISDNTWGQTGTYLVTGVGADTVWSSTYGFSVQFQYVSGTNYNSTYTSLASLFNNYFSSISGTVVPNYTKKYRSSNFSTLNNTSYVSFDNYDFINVGDEISYVPGIASIQFKDDAGNNVKAISYNNLTGAMQYDGLVQAFAYDPVKSNLWSINVDTARKTTNSTHDNVIAIGDDARSHTNSVAIGANSDSAGGSAVAIGPGAYSGGASVASGWNSYATNSATAVGAFSYAYSGESTVIGYNTLASGAWSTAIGSNARALARTQFSYATSGSSTYRNQTTIIQWSNAGLSSNGIRYIRLGSGFNSDTSPFTWSGAGFDLSSLTDRTDRTMAIAIATVMYKPVNDQNNDDVKVQEIKFIVRTTSNNNWAIDQLSTNTIYAGSGSLHTNWETSFEINEMKWLFCKINKGSDTTNIGICVKVEFQVLTTQ
jgi:hypothetical protein